MRTENVYCISVNVRRLGIRKRVSAEQVGTDADREMLHVSKDVLQCPEYEAILSLDGKIRSNLRRKTAGNSYLRDGIYLVNAAKLDDLTAWLNEQGTERDGLIDRFIAAYERAKGEAQSRLGSLFDAGDYPPVERVRAAFGLSWQIFSFPSVDSLREVTPGVWQQEAAKIRSLWNEALEASRQLLRTELADLIDRLSERLQPGDDGKPKRLHATAVTNLTEFLTEFTSREITNDQELKDLIGRMQKALSGVDPESLRKSDNLRDFVRQRMDEAKGQLDTMITQGGRLYVLDEEVA